MIGQVSAPADRYDLARFVAAQDHRRTYDRALAELQRGRKRSHWMWFVFPQLHGLGSSAMSTTYAISGLDEARAYLDHEVLGPRLRECSAVVAGLTASPLQVFGGVDAQKLHSSMTLFHRAALDEPAVRAVLDTHFGGDLDPGTQALLQA